MSAAHELTEVERRALEQVQDALRLVCVALPHLAGLAHVVRVSVDPRVPSAGIFPSGRLVVNAGWFNQLARGDAVFVVAHELLHLALQTARRAAGGDARLFNCAHDYIINDMLADALGRPVPAGGLQWPGARELSAESLVQQLRDNHAPGGSDPRGQAWDASGTAPDTAMAAALRAAGLAEPAGSAVDFAADALPTELEREWFPEVDPSESARERAAVERAAAHAVSLERLREATERLLAGRGSEPDAEPRTAVCDALRTLYRPPWELALQRWLDGVAPGERSYLRPSRRTAPRPDVALAGRRRAGWTLHVVLDTSGSMARDLARLLGTIGAFCEGAGVGEVRLLQCDAEVTRDERVPPEALQRFELAGFGGSDLSAALNRLADDPEVEAAVVITDGEIDYPAEPMPYAVLWALTAPADDFDPPYGRVIVLPAD